MDARRERIPASQQFLAVMLFSVIIPTFNRAQFLPAAIDSVLAQECHDFELIVVDAGSTDDTSDVLKKYGDRVRVTRGDARGPGPARNLGWQQARGEYVAFLDSDDVWFPWTLATYREAIDRNAGPAFIAGTHVDFRETETPPHLRRENYRDRAHPDYLATATTVPWIGTCAVAVKRLALQAAGGFAEHGFNAEDSHLWLRLGAELGFVRVEAPPVFAYRRHSESAVSSVQNSGRGVLAMIECEHTGGYPGGNNRRRSRREILSVHSRPASLACLRAGAQAEAWRIYRRTFRWNLCQLRLRYLLAFPLFSLRAVVSR